MKAFFRVNGESNGSKRCAESVAFWELGHTSAQLALLGDRFRSPIYAAHHWIARRFSH